MKILVMTEQFPPLVGGAAVAVYNYVRHWTEDTVVVVTTKRPGAEIFDRNLPFEVRRVWVWDGPIAGFHPIGGDTGFLVPPEDPVSLARAVEKILGDPALAEFVGRQARGVVENQFSIERMVRETVTTYENCLARKGLQ